MLDPVQPLEYETGLLDQSYLDIKSGQCLGSERPATPVDLVLLLPRGNEEFFTAQITKHDANDIVV